MGTISEDFRDWNNSEVVEMSRYLLINLSEPFYDTNVGPRRNLARIHVRIETRLALT